MSEMPNILRLEEIKKEDILSVGGKGASLGEMLSIGLPVPGGFVVTAQAFRKFLVETGIDHEIESILEGIDVENSDALEAAANRAKKTVTDTTMPEEIRADLVEAYTKMGGDVVVAIRSSATAEDLPDASFAGQQDTYLNIKGVEDVVESVKKCWASLYGARAVYYRARQGFDDSTVNIAVVVQKLIFSEKAGVMFTKHPVTGEALTIIEGSWGLGEAVVSGEVSPDNYVYDQMKKRLIDKLIAEKEIKISPDGEKGTIIEKLSQEERDAQVLSNEEVGRLASFGEIAESHYGIPQDLEWGIVGEHIYILQSRPITTISYSAGGAVEMVTQGRVILEGAGASPGVASGKVVVIKGMSDLSVVSEGDILVARMTNPDMVPAMRKVAAIITDEGGMTCHAAIVSRELGTPAIVGTKKATALLKSGQIVTVEGEKGLVYEGRVSAGAPVPVTGAPVSAAPLMTATSIKVNVSLPEAAKRAAATNADGVGLLRIEHLILGMQGTPGWYISEGRQDEFIDELYSGIKIVMDEFNGKPVWVRTLDSPTDEFRNMLGGEYEPEEHNPMLGWRGIRRDLQSPEQFKLQVEAFKRLWDEGYDNLGLMFPLIGHPDEFIRARAMLKEWGVNVEKVSLGVMVEIPSSAILIEDLCKAGISFASFGTNDLIQYTLAIDRNNENVTDMYNPHHPAVLKLIDYAISICREYGVECSICGQAGSDPSMVEWLVEHGISSVSANIDAVVKIRETAAKTEQRMILNMARAPDAGKRLF